MTEGKYRHRLRYSGILMHPTSLPGGSGIGDLGQSAYDFIDFLDSAGQSLWQVLPLGPTGFGNSPYQPYSAFAGQPLLISLSLLIEDGFLNERDLITKDTGIALTRYAMPKFDEYNVQYDTVRSYKTALLHKAYEEFKRDSHGLEDEFDGFARKEGYWLDDYALFMSFRDMHSGAPWREWGAGFKDPDPAGKAAYLRRYSEETGYYRFEQFIFLRQWRRLREYANKKGIYIVGDIPIFVSPDGADVWADKSLFRLDRNLMPVDVAGVPPDYFSATGQLWGNPLYNWKNHRKDGYRWWISRIRKQLELTDYLRIDHFRGFEAYWAVPYGETTAAPGRWVKGPGTAFFRALQKEFGKDMPIFAEDLGIITPSVERLRDRFRLPGMKVLQFAFESEDESDYLPYLYDENCICYTGTHDNNTAVGWYLSTSEENRSRARRYMMCSGNDINWDFIKAAISSTARYAIFPMQDLLGYGGDSRMNTPGTAEGNWSWRCTRQALDPGLAASLRDICSIYGRDKSRLERLQEENV